MVDKQPLGIRFRIAINEGDLATAKQVFADDPNLPKRLSEKRVWLLKDAAKTSTPQMLKFLTQEVGEDVNKQDANGFTALHFAVMFGELENARALLQLGADPNRDCPLFGITHHRVEDPMAMADILLEYGADVNQLIVSEHMPTQNVLSKALCDGSNELVSYLRTKGAKLPDELVDG